MEAGEEKWEERREVRAAGAGAGCREWRSENGGRLLLP